ncbi:MerR family transcriptional regulator [Amycolatopsis suaedae]|uniref:MerR family transcriptional regulator n=1 Tax=Amycolatopsis suaedae TaxID=2510978 RepID=A0A4Q7J783_9PSEU|nr:MerR family transcriptional regulator [Amycolatopsis suaedae]RZQ63521.1 MerR family transcriptional regulator [Amycolatopsis suaedae]
MRIGELSQRAGVSVRSLRYYEEEGLLSPDRDENGYRRFTERDVATVTQIQLFYSAGLRSSRIAELLPCVAGVEDHVVPSAGLAEDLEQARHRLRGQIADLRTSLDIVDRVLAAAALQRAGMS